MRHPLFAFSLPAAAVLAAVFTGSASLSSASRASNTAHASVATPAPGAQAQRLKLLIAPEGNEARYRVREQLAGLALPNDAVGKTSAVTGSLTIESNGKIVKEESKFVVDLSKLASDQDRRDNYVRRNTLQTAQFPNAEFVPASATGLTGTLPRAGDLAFKLLGDLTVRGVTKPSTWDVKGKMLPSGEISGTATTWFRFADFGLTQPRVAIVLSIVDSINLEIDFRLVPSAARPDR